MKELSKDEGKRIKDKFLERMRDKVQSKAKVHL